MEYLRSTRICAKTHTYTSMHTNTHLIHVTDDICDIDRRIVGVGKSFREVDHFPLVFPCLHWSACYAVAKTVCARCRSEKGHVRTHDRIEVEGSERFRKR